MSCADMNNLTIHQMIEDHAEKTPHHIALISGNLSYSYSELNQKANQLAHYLRTFACIPEDLIAVAIDRSPPLLIAILAIIKAGCAYLPIDANHPEKRLQHILNDAKSSLLITEKKYQTHFNFFSGQLILLDEIWKEINAESTDNLNLPITTNNLIYVIYTSGSTGTPKGVLLEHKSVINFTQWFGNFTQCQLQDRIDFSSSIIFDMPVANTIVAFALGLQVVICSDTVKKEVSHYLQHLNKNKINIIKLTPSYFKILVQQAQNRTLALPDLQAIVLGGEILHTKDCVAWLNMYPEHIILNEYGPTETTVAITHLRVTKENVETLGPQVPIGKPGFNIECKLFNSDVEIYDIGTQGELYVGGMCLARGYLNQEKLTAEKFILDPTDNHKKFYKTGDICCYLPDGNIEYIKRIDEQIKIRGYRVEPGEIEKCLVSHPLIKEASVIAYGKASEEKKLIAYYILNDKNKTLKIAELRYYLADKLAEYMIPTLFFKLDQFPLTENGKLNKKSFPEPSFAKEITLPANKIERNLVQIWQQAFNIDQIGNNTNFFELGGDSLIAARIIIEIEKTFNKKMSIENLYQSLTIKELAKQIKLAEKMSPQIIPKQISVASMAMIPLADFQFTLWMLNFFEPKVNKLNIVTRRRILGRIDHSAFNHCLNWVVKKHEILAYRIRKWFPAQYLNENLKTLIIENDLTRYNSEETEWRLIIAMNELINCHNRQKNHSLIIKLFYLKNEQTEIQLYASHLIFDAVSAKILLTELSEAYLFYRKAACLPLVNKNIQFKDYILSEKSISQNQEAENIYFWKMYFQDTTLLKFPEDMLTFDMKNKSYSTYLELPRDFIQNIYQIGVHASLSFTNLLSAAIALSLKNVAGNLNDNIFVNIVKSTREDASYDQTIGCFLRLDALKINLKTKLNLIDLAKSIQQERMNIESYQSCPSMVKLACLDKTYRKKYISNFIIKIFCNLYCMIFYKLQLSPTTLMMYARLNSLRKKQYFLVNINLLNDFISSDQEQTLFGLKLANSHFHKHDLSNVDNVLDISFLQNGNMNKSYLVISGNLIDSYRQEIGKNIINMIEAVS